MDKAFYYTFSSGSGYNGFFDLNTKTKTCTYYAFKAFGNCHRLKNQVYVKNKTNNIQALAATDHSECSVLNSNYEGKDEKIVISMENLPGGNRIFVDCISENCEPKTEVYAYCGDSFVLELNVIKHSVISINIMKDKGVNYSIYSRDRR